MLMSPTFPFCTIAPDDCSSSMYIFLRASDFICGIFVDSNVKACY